MASYALDSDGQSFSVKVFVNAPYDRYVSRDTRFWQASGIDVSLTASGLSVQTQSLLSILIGGIAFETPAGSTSPAAEANTDFPLFSDRTTAFKLSARNPQDFVLIFKDSVRGLTPGAPVEFHGIPVGEVVDIQAKINAETFEFSAPVTIRVDATRLGVQIVDLPPGADFATARQKLIDTLVAHGVRAQLRSGSLLTGALFVSFDFYPDDPPVTVDWSHPPVRVADRARASSRCSRRSSSNIVDKLDQMPFKAIGRRLRKTLGEVDHTLVSARGTLDTGRDTFQDAGKLIEPNSVLGAELGNTLQEVSRAARSVASGGLPRAPSRGAHSRQDRGGAMRADRLPTGIPIALVGAGGRLRQRTGALLYARCDRDGGRGAGARYALSSGRSSIPAAVDRPEFVVQIAPNRVDIDEFNRWAAPLNDGIARVVATNLSVLLGTSDVAMAPLANFRPPVACHIDVQRFESIPGQSVLIDAIWTVHHTAGASRAPDAPSRARPSRPRASTPLRRRTAAPSPP